jgi:Domain of unknown function (DUF4258)
LTSIRQWRTILEVTRDDLIFTDHAVDRMAERGIVIQEVIATISAGEVIASFQDDQPYPSTLSLSMIKGTPLHVLWATHPKTRKIIVITTYVPDERWGADFRTRTPR